MPDEKNTSEPAKAETATARPTSINDPAHEQRQRDWREGRLEQKEDEARSILRNAAAPAPVSAQEPLGMTVPGYESLAAVFGAAYDQAARGKGKERHANGLPFTQQKILNLTRMSGIDAPVYQVSKKALEASGMAKRGELDAAMKELLGAINYAAAAVIYLGELRAARDQQKN